MPHYNNYASALINGAPAPGHSSGEAVVAMQRAAAEALPRDFGYEWTGVTYQELSAGSIATVVLALAIVLRVHDPGRAIRELVDAVHGAVVGAAGAGRLARRDLGEAACRSTSIRRSAS